MKYELIEVIKNEVARKNWSLVSNEDTVTSPMKYKLSAVWAKVIRGTVNTVSMIIYITKIIAQIVIDIWLILGYLWDNLNILAANIEDAIVDGLVILAEAYKTYQPIAKKYVNLAIKNTKKTVNGILKKLASVLALVKAKMALVLNLIKTKLTPAWIGLKKQVIRLKVYILLGFVFASMAVEAFAKESIEAIAGALKASWDFRQKIVDDDK